VGGHAFASRAITESFAVVRVADYEGVRVTQDNQPVARTNAGGYAVLPRLRAYDVNPISVVQHDLPLDAEIASLTMAAVPYYRSGVMLEFPVRRARGAVFRLRLDDGAEMPSGALVDVVGGAASFPVALEGVVYVTGLAAHNRLLARWKGQSCEFDLALPASPDPLPDLGTIHCRGVAR
jgi:outer membrane usher protein